MFLSLLPSPRWNQKGAKKLRKNRSPIKFFNTIPFPFLCWALLTETFPCRSSQSRRVSWWSISLHRVSWQGWMWDEKCFWPLASPKIRPDREANWDRAHCFCWVYKPLSQAVPLLKDWKIKYFQFFILFFLIYKLQFKNMYPECTLCQANSRVGLDGNWPVLPTNM